MFNLKKLKKLREENNCLKHQLIDAEHDAKRYKRWYEEQDNNEVVKRIKQYNKTLHTYIKERDNKISDFTHKLEIMTAENERLYNIIKQINEIKEN